MKNKFYQCGQNTSPYKIHSAADYFNALAKCEIVVKSFTRDDFQHLLTVLQVDKRRTKKFGLRVTEDVPTMGLLKDDRFEPSVDVPDWALLFVDGAPMPTSITFMRPALQTVLKHRNPIFEVVPGGIPAVCALDIMHMFPLGIMAQY
eukprot:939535-Amphidinium_carterae.1